MTVSICFTLSSMRCFIGGSFCLSSTPRECGARDDVGIAWLEGITRFALMDAMGAGARVVFGGGERGPWRGRAAVGERDLKNKRNFIFDETLLM